MKLKPEIVRGAIVEVMDWPWRKGLEKPYLVTRRHRNAGVEYASIVPAVEGKDYNESGYDWTVADLKKIGDGKVPVVKIPMVLSEMDWTVMVEMVVERDGWDSYFTWEAWAQEYTRTGHFRHEVKQADEQDARTRTVKACLREWEAFAKANGWIKWEARHRGLGSAEDLPMWARLKDCSDTYKLQWSAAHNDYSFLYNMMTFQCGGYGNCELIKGREKAKRLRQMSKDGDLRRFRLVKRMMERDQGLVRYYDNFGQIRATAPFESKDNDWLRKHVTEERKKAGIRWSMSPRSERKERRKPCT